MINATLELEFTPSVLLEKAIEKDIKARFKWYRKLQEMRRNGTVIAPAHFENELYFITELNKQRRILRTANVC